MNRSFTHRWWNRAVIVDERGIHEHRKGREFASIPWEELHLVTTEKILSVRGTKITPRLTSIHRIELLTSVTHEWQLRFPERELEHSRLCHRRGAYAAYLWLPLLMLAPWACFHVLGWFLGWPAYVTKHLEKLNHGTALGLVVVAGTAIFHAYKTRKSE